MNRLIFTKGDVLQHIMASGTFLSMDAKIRAMATFVSSFPRQTSKMSPVNALACQSTFLCLSVLSAQETEPMTSTMQTMKPMDESTVREFRMPWISYFMIYAALVPFAASLGLAVYWRDHLGVEPLLRWMVLFQVVAFIAMLGQLWMTHRTFIRLSSDRIEMRIGLRLRTIMKADIRSAGWYTTRGPVLKLRDEASTLIRVPMLDGMNVSVLRKWLGSDCADLSDA